MDRHHIYSNSAAIFVTATQLKGCNVWNFYLQQRQVYPNLRDGLASFLTLPVLSCVVFTRFPVGGQSDTVFLNIIFLVYDPPLYLHLIGFAAL